MKKILTALALTLTITLTPAQSNAAPPTTNTTKAKALKAEAKRYASPAWAGVYLPGDECSRWKYLGRGKKDRTNGRAIWSARSEINPKVFHTFKVAKSKGLDKKGRCTVKINRVRR